MFIELNIINIIRSFVFCCPQIRGLTGSGEPLPKKSKFSLDLAYFLTPPFPTVNRPHSTFFFPHLLVSTHLRTSTSSEPRILTSTSSEPHILNSNFFGPRYLLRLCSSSDSNFFRDLCCRTNFLRLLGHLRTLTFSGISGVGLFSGRQLCC